MRTCELTREGISYQILQNLIEQGRVEKKKDATKLMMYASKLGAEKKARRVVGVWL